MRLAFFQRDADVLYRLMPFVSCLAGAILSVVPLQVPGLPGATPAFALMAIYHWTIYRPDLMPPSGVFAIGLALDLLDGTPYIGVSSLIFLIVRSLVQVGHRRVTNQPFPIVWAGFLAVASAAIALEWLFVGALNAAPLGPRPFLFQILATVAAFPVASYVLAQLQRGFLARV
jgi:rod shape-determining protein MreD